MRGGWAAVALCVALVGACKRDGDPVCPVMCGDACLPASACAESTLCPASAPCDPCSGQCRQLCATTADCQLDLACCSSAGSNVCVDTQIDVFHCGGCATSCGAAADTCLSGECSCGGLGLSCGDQQLCCGGACIAPDENNCGACGVRCNAPDGGADLAGTLGGPNQKPAALAVDTVPAGSSTVVNGVLEPGETVVVAPSWQNEELGAVMPTGAASAFNGPAGGSYALNGASAKYPTIEPGAIGMCSSGAFCYAATVTSAFSRPVLHWDATFLETLSTGASKTWTLHIGGSFDDVPTSHPFYRYVETLLHQGITGGCDATNFCPDVAINRAALSAFVANTLVGPSGIVPASGKVGTIAYDCSLGGSSAFSDVMPTDPACKHIHYVAKLGIDAGCASGIFCPTMTASRGVLAIFVARALVGGGNAAPAIYTDPTTGLSYNCNTIMVHFGDESLGSEACASIEYLWARGVTAGCGNAGNYCPNADATRADAAAFLVRGFKLNLYGP